MPSTHPFVLEVQRHLNTRRFGRTMRGFDVIDSTNTEAAAWAADGAPEGSLVVAEYQSKGRGRHGRTWAARAGQNLTFSVVLRPSLAPDQLGAVTLAASVAVAEALDAFRVTGRTEIKWPNDLLMEGRKCCGMLLESSVLGAQHVEYVILGIGLNVNQEAFPPDVEETATSLLLATGRRFARAAVLAEVLAALEARYDQLLIGEGDGIGTAYETRLYRKDERIILHDARGQTRTEGVVLGVTSGGALRLRTAQGEQTFYAGEVTTQHPTHVAGA